MKQRATAGSQVTISDWKKLVNRVCICQEHYREVKKTNQSHFHAVFYKTVMYSDSVPMVLDMKQILQ